MGALKRLVKFIGGGVVGAAVGSAVALLLAPTSGRELQQRTHELIRRAKLAGIEAKAAKEDELIRKFRADVNDPEALEEERLSAREEVAAALQAVGLGLNAPGAIAAQEAVARDPGESA